jgi:hypothetical protein
MRHTTRIATGLYSIDVRLGLNFAVCRTTVTVSLRNWQLGLKAGRSSCTARASGRFYGTTRSAQALAWYCLLQD